MKEEKHVAIILAAGKGSRMKSDIPKQFLILNGKPLLYYSVQAFESSFVNEIILVTGQGQEEYCRHEIIEKYRFQKVSRIIAGGKERYDSVYQGLRAVKDADYVYIHDGARPFLTALILNNAKECVEKYHACAAGVPSKDTIKIADEYGFVRETPPRENVWNIQTPQVFSYTLIKDAYEQLYRLRAEKKCSGEDCIQITDDAMVVEYILKKQVKLFWGSYENIKITTPEDISIAEGFLEREKYR